MPKSVGKSGTLLHFHGFLYYYKYKNAKDCKRISEQIAFRREYKDVLDMLMLNQDLICPLDLSACENINEPVPLN
jgi:hypothetical protein